MKTLDRYIVRNFLASALLCFVVLMSLRIVSDLFFNMDEFTKTHRSGEDRSVGLVVGEIGSYYAAHSLQYFRELSGVIIVSAAAFALARMNHTNELTAILASGVSLHRVLLPVLMCAIGMNFLVVLDSEVLIPAAKEYLARDRDDPSGTDSFRVKLVTDNNKTSVFSRRFYPAQARLVNPLVLLRDETYNYLGHISAPNAVYDASLGAWVFKSVGKDQAAVLHIPGAEKAPTADFIPTLTGCDELLQAVAQKPENQGIQWTNAKCIQQLEECDPSNLTIRAARLDLASVDGKCVGTALQEPRFTLKLGPREIEFAGDSAVYGEMDGRPGWKLTGGRILYRSDLNPRDLALRQSGQWMQYMSTAEMTQLLNLQQASDPEKVLLMRHSRFADFVNNILMLLVAVPFILSRERNLKSSAGLTVLMVGGFYVFIYVSRYLGIQPPALAAWLPILVFGPVAAAMVDAVKT